MSNACIYLGEYKKLEHVREVNLKKKEKEMEGLVKVKTGNEIGVRGLRRSLELPEDDGLERETHLENNTLPHFERLKASKLKAFILARCTDDTWTSAKVNGTKKGKLKDTKSGGTNLITMAFEV